MTVYYLYCKVMKHEDAYNLAEIDYQEKNGKRLYSNFRSFESALCRKLGKRKNSTTVK
jgi:hypothetical protein